jgi:hypothetical protein
VVAEGLPQCDEIPLVHLLRHGKSNVPHAGAKRLGRTEEPSCLVGPLLRGRDASERFQGIDDPPLALDASEEAQRTSG